jgi:predicted RNase H-like HicB family nuclease
MAGRFVLSGYMDEAMVRAVYEELEDGSLSGWIPCCPGVITFGGTRRECEEELRSVLEEWILLGLKLGHRLPVVAGIDLNAEPAREPVEAV